MQDQIHHLENAGIRACAIAGGSDWMGAAKTMGDILSGVREDKVNATGLRSGHEHLLR